MAAILTRHRHPAPGTRTPDAGYGGSGGGGDRRVIRVAAVGDLHLRPAVRGRFRSAFAGLAAGADVLLLAGDLTNGGMSTEADLLREELDCVPVPVVAVLGNHDHDEGLGDRVADALRAVGAQVLDGDTAILDVAGTRLGIAGVMGGGGGFPGSAAVPAAWAEEPEWLARAERGPADARRLRSLLAGLDCDIRIALTHFAPVPDTLAGEPPEIYPGLGCHLLAGAVDDGGARLAIHGHAHSGSECGRTPGGTPVRNVAYPVLRRPYATYHLSDGRVEAG
jgi:Icc-related predicted phosphoesterase